MSRPKTERLICKPRTEEERVAITLEYFSSFVIWTEMLSQGELISLALKIENLMHSSNADTLNQLLKNTQKYIVEEATLRETIEDFPLCAHDTIAQDYSMDAKE
jgi:hypothetical protein